MTEVSYANNPLCHISSQPMEKKTFRYRRINDQEIIKGWKDFSAVIYFRYLNTSLRETNLGRIWGMVHHTLLSSVWILENTAAWNDAIVQETSAGCNSGFLMML